MRDFDGSQVLYRLGFASGMRAARRKEESEHGNGNVERAARSFEARIEASILLQASLEAWINRAFETNGLHANGGGWVARWNGVGHVAKALGRPIRSLSRESTGLLEELSVVRNLLLHGDATSRAKFAEHFDNQDLHDVLTVAYIEQLFQRAETVWSEARAITGLQTPGSYGAWVARDEFM